VADYPINSAELSRRLLGRELTPDDYPFVQKRVRATLQRLGCPRMGGSHRPPYLVDEQMARQVAEKLGMPLR